MATLIKHVIECLAHCSLLVSFVDSIVLNNRLNRICRELDNLGIGQTILQKPDEWNYSKQNNRTDQTLTLRTVRCSDTVKEGHNSEVEIDSSPKAPSIFRRRTHKRPATCDSPCCDGIDHTELVKSQDRRKYSENILQTQDPVHLPKDTSSKPLRSSSKKITARNIREAPTNSVNRQSSTVKSRWKRSKIRILVRKVDRYRSKVSSSAKLGHLNVPCKPSSVTARIFEVDTSERLVVTRRKLEVVMSSVCSSLNLVFRKLDSKMIVGSRLTCEIRPSYISFKLRLRDQTCLFVARVPIRRRNVRRRNISGGNVEKPEKLECRRPECSRDRCSEKQRAQNGDSFYSPCSDNDLCDVGKTDGSFAGKQEETGLSEAAGKKRNHLVSSSTDADGGVPKENKETYFNSVPVCHHTATNTEETGVPLKADVLRKSEGENENRDAENSALKHPAHQSICTCDMREDRISISVRHESDSIVNISLLESVEVSLEKAPNEEAESNRFKAVSSECDLRCSCSSKEILDSTFPGKETIVSSFEDRGNETTFTRKRDGFLSVSVQISRLTVSSGPVNTDAICPAIKLASGDSEISHRESAGSFVRDEITIVHARRSPDDDDSEMLELIRKRRPRIEEQSVAPHARQLNKLNRGVNVRSRSDIKHTNSPLNSLVNNERTGRCLLKTRNNVCSNLCKISTDVKKSNSLDSVKLRAISSEAKIRCNGKPEKRSTSYFTASKRKREANNGIGGGSFCSSISSKSVGGLKRLIRRKLRRILRDCKDNATSTSDVFATSNEYFVNVSRQQVPKPCDLSTCSYCSSYIKKSNISKLREMFITDTGIRKQSDGFPDHLNNYFKEADKKDNIKYNCFEHARRKGVVRCEDFEDHRSDRCNGNQIKGTERARNELSRRLRENRNENSLCRCDRCREKRCPGITASLKSSNSTETVFPRNGTTRENRKSRQRRTDGRKIQKDKSTDGKQIKKQIEFNCIYPCEVPSLGTIRSYCSKNIYLCRVCNEEYHCKICNKVYYRRICNKEDHVQNSTSNSSLCNGTIRARRTVRMTSGSSAKFCTRKLAENRRKCRKCNARSVSSDSFGSRDDFVAFVENCEKYIGDLALEFREKLLQYVAFCKSVKRMLMERGLSDNANNEVNTS